MQDVLTLGEVVATQARLQPRKVAVRDSRRELTFAVWHERANRLANGMLDLGLDRGDRVVVLAYNCAEWMEIYVGLARAGLVAVPVNFRLTPAEIADIAEHSQARGVICQSVLTERIEPIRADLAISPHHYVEFGRGHEPAKQWTAYEQLIADAPAADPAVTVDPAAPG